MTSLERQLSIIETYAYDESMKKRLIEMMSFIWHKMKDRGHPVTISSSVGGKHKSKSKHYSCEAIDINPDKGISADYIAEVKRVVDLYSESMRILIEFNRDVKGNPTVYRCTHIEFNNVKKGLYRLDYARNISSPMQV